MTSNEPIEAPECIRCKHISDCDIRDKMIATDSKCIRFEERKR